ncbi:uncharacterized protein A4U43_C10F17900 [Asparagus officinalis]|uniref:Protein argonaute N-terminal domain-containing protein n=1 Tax=Asparagus officinalis TaxID=4686 RepID=A0A5P1E8G4_ASPOF|nr:uncharacterized protein A4U43_C10F17900 [Asparagus officinalis]
MKATRTWNSSSNNCHNGMERENWPSYCWRGLRISRVPWQGWWTRRTTTTKRQGRTLPRPAWRPWPGTPPRSWTIPRPRILSRPRILPRPWAQPRLWTVAGRSEAGPSGGSTTPLSPDLHQANQASSQPQHPEVISGQVEQQLQQLSIQDEGETSQAIQTVSSSKSNRAPLRPGIGSAGVKCIVKANHFFVQLLDKDVHQYDVSITPEVKSRSMNRDVIKELVKLYRLTHLGGRLPAYDGRKNLYTAGPLPFDSKSFQITLLDEEEGPGGQRFCLDHSGY